MTYQQSPVYMKITKNILANTAIALINVIYVILASYKLQYPLIDVDDVDFTLRGLSIYKKGWPYFFDSFNQHSNLMLNFYHGGADAFLFLPFFPFFKDYTLLVRIISIFYSSLAIIFTYLFTKELFNKKIALMSSFLLATFPSFIYASSRRSFYTAIPTLLFILMAFLFFLLKWHKTKKKIYFFLACFLCGFGLSIRIWFLWIIVSLVVVKILLNINYIGRYKRQGFRIVMFYSIGILFFLIGTNVMLLDNLIKFKTFTFLIDAIKNPAGAGINNLDYLYNLKGIWLNFLKNIFSNPGWVNGIPLLQISQKQGFLQHIGIAEKIFVLSLSFLMVKSPIASFSGKKIYFIVLIVILVLLQAPFTPSSLATVHLLILLPFVCILIVLGITKIYYLFHSLLKLNRIIGIIVAYVLFLLLLFNNIQIVMAYNDAINKTHGVREWSTDAFREMVMWLRHENIAEIIPLSTIRTSLLLFTNNNISVPLDFPTISKIRKQENSFNSIFKSGGDIYYVASLELFRDVLKNIKGYNVLIKKRFYDKRREIAFIVFKVYPISQHE